MQTHNPETVAFAKTSPSMYGAWRIRTFLPPMLAVIALMAGGCNRDASVESIETDAHGYQCMKCAGKFYTERKVFLESKCPKCKQDSLADVVGYLCEKDHHLTIRPKVSGPEGASICERCGAILKNAMVSPREKDMMTWGATKAGPP